MRRCKYNVMWMYVVQVMVKPKPKFIEQYPVGVAGAKAPAPSLLDEVIPSDLGPIRFARNQRRRWEEVVTGYLDLWEFYMYLQPRMRRAKLVPLRP